MEKAEYRRRIIRGGSGGVCFLRQTRTNVPWPGFEEEDMDRYTEELEKWSLEAVREIERTKKNCISNKE